MLENNTPVSPAHYKSGGLELIDIWKAKLTGEQFIGLCKGNVLKYVIRAEEKNGKEDYLKAMQYLKWIVEAYEKKESENNENC